MKAPKQIVRYQKSTVDNPIHAEKPEFIAKCDNDFSGMQDVMRTEYIRADLVAEKDEETKRLREALEYRYSQTVCGCGHPACKRCQMDEDTRKALQEDEA